MLDRWFSGTSHFRKPPVLYICMYIYIYYILCCTKRWQWEIPQHQMIARRSSKTWPDIRPQDSWMSSWLGSYITPSKWQTTFFIHEKHGTLHWIYHVRLIDWRYAHTLCWIPCVTMVKLHQVMIKPWQKNILLSSLILVYDSLYLEHPKFVPKAQKKQPHLVVEVPQETLIRRQVHDVKVGTFTMALSGSTEGWARDDEGSKKCSKWI